MNNSYHTTASGWLFDLYLDGDVIRLWFIREDGTYVSLWEAYAPSFYVRTTTSVGDNENIPKSNNLCPV
ncbi:MAG: hypothetical protein HZA08_00285 [Nitrospirae bacterium]|nr:hypothetical protein [Nitrospirota bacterium]